MKKTLFLIIISVKISISQGIFLATNNEIISSKTPITTPSTPFTVPVSGSGTRLMWIADRSAFRVGTVDGNQWDATNIGVHSFASGDGSKASGISSIAMGTGNTSSAFCSVSFGAANMSSSLASFASGYGTISSGLRSTSTGFNTTASGINSFVGGDGSTASGQNSIAFGSSSNAYATGAIALGSAQADGIGSVAIGSQVRSMAFGSVALGIYNNFSGDPFMWQDSDPLFVIGNGRYTRSNAFTILKNGNTGIKTDNPRASLDITSTDGIIVPVGTTGQRPTTPVIGTIRYNVTTNKFEGYSSSGWVDLH